MLIYFGWPAAGEDDPERAARAGLAIVDATTALNTALADDDGTRLAIRFGMPARSASRVCSGEKRVCPDSVDEQTKETSM